MALRALLLDFDGLVCDTERAAYRSWEEMYGELGLVFTPRLWARMMGRVDGEAAAIADLGHRLGRPVDTGLVFQRRLRKWELAHQEPLRPGVADLLDAARTRGLALAVVSSSTRSWVDSHLHRLGVRDRFSVVVTGDDVAAHKPAPDSYLTALAALDLPAADALAFEDSATGVRAACAAGLSCVAVPGLVGDRTGLDAADLLLDTLAGTTLDALLARAEGTVTA
jgi:putative hydrolase of the HAD superfamily